MSKTLFVVKFLRDNMSGAGPRFRVTDPLHGTSAVVPCKPADRSPAEVFAVLDFYYSQGGSEAVTDVDVSFHGSKGPDAYYMI